MRSTTILFVTTIMSIGFETHGIDEQSEPTPVVTQARPADFGLRWIRREPFTITSTVVTDKTFDVNTYRGAGLNTVLLWETAEGVLRDASRAGLPWIYHAENRRDPAGEGFAELVAMERNRAKQYMATYSGGKAFVVWDEVKGAYLDYVRKSVGWAQQTFPDLLVYVNVHPFEPGANYWVRGKSAHKVSAAPDPYNYEIFLRDVIRRTGTDVLSIDPYPFCDEEEYPFYGDVERLIRETYFYTLGTARDAAQEANIPYWVFVQAFAIPSARYLPSESDFRMEVFVPLAYGFTGIQYFLYQTPLFTGIMNTDGSRGELYPHVADVSAEVSHLGKTLRLLTSADVRYIPGAGGGKANPIPTGIAAFDSAAGARWGINDIQVKEDGITNNGVIGFFKDSSAGKYFMLVNVKRDKGESAEAMALSYTLMFDDSVDHLYRLNRETGDVDRMELAEHTLQVKLPGGTGDLFKIGDDQFAFE